MICCIYIILRQVSAVPGFLVFFQSMHGNKNTDVLDARGRAAIPSIKYYVLVQKTLQRTVFGPENVHLIVIIV